MLFKKTLKNFEIAIARKKEFCPCCGKLSFILILLPLKKSLKIEPRNNYACANCLSLSRHRALAEGFLRHFKLADIGELKAKLKLGKLKVYDANVPPLFPFIKDKNYITSSFSPSKKFKFQDLEKLTFKSSQFNAVITCDILEHIFDLKAALLQIKRVLRPSGVHFFTVPVNFKAERTVLRAIMEKDRICHLAPCLYHLNLFENKKTLAIRDFGKDFKRYFKENFEVRLSKRKKFGADIYFFKGLKK